MIHDLPSDASFLPVLPAEETFMAQMREAGIVPEEDDDTWS